MLDGEHLFWTLLPTLLHEFGSSQAADAWDWRAHWKIAVKKHEIHCIFLEFPAAKKEKLPEIQRCFFLNLFPMHQKIPAVFSRQALGDPMVFQ